jgi:hypothetical protein
MVVILGLMKEEDRMKRKRVEKERVIFLLRRNENEESSRDVFFF